MRQSTEIVGTIHLYGTSRVGFGWLATAKIVDQSIMFGDGEPKRLRSATECLFIAARAIVEARDWDSSGLVEVHQDTNAGPRVATAYLDDVPYFGDLKWTAAPVYEISADALIAASEAPA